MRLKTRLLMITGAVLAVLPYLGFPILWKRVLMTLGGIFIIIIAFLLRMGFKQLRARYKALEVAETASESEATLEQ